MNTQIKTLANVWANRRREEGLGIVYVFTEPALQTFAASIIRECAMIAIKRQTEDDIDNIVSKNLAKDIAEEFIKHFGIK